MAAFIDENQQFIDPDTSVPIVNGKIFFGVQGADPVLNPITVFSDRGLTTGIGTSVLTDGSGRPVQKVFIPGRYSFVVKNSAGVQKLIDLDAGSIAAVGVTTLTNISGANTITAQADPPITELLNGEQFTFTASAINTDKMTLDVGTGAKPFKFNFNEEMAPGFIQKDQTVNLTYNSTTDSFAWDNEGRAISLLTNVGGTANAITADGGPSTAGYVNQQLYSFKVATTNTGNVTLKIGILPVISIKSNGAELGANVLKANTSYLVSYNSIGPVFDLINGEIFSNEVFTQFSNTLNSSSVIPQDGTIPQITEGVEIMSQAFTPKFADSKIEIEVKVQGGISQLGGEGNVIAWSIALFKDSVTNALMADGFSLSSATTVFGNHRGVVSFVFREASVNTTSRTYKVRGGQTTTENFTFGGIFGILPHSNIRIREIRAGK